MAGGSVSIWGAGRGLTRPIQALGQGAEKRGRWVGSPEVVERGLWGGLGVYSSRRNLRRVGWPWRDHWRFQLRSVGGMKSNGSVIWRCDPLLGQAYDQVLGVEPMHGPLSDLPTRTSTSSATPWVQVHVLGLVQRVDLGDVATPYA